MPIAKAELFKAVPLGALPLDDLLWLLVHPPPVPVRQRWEFLGRESPAF